VKQVFIITIMVTSSPWHKTELKLQFRTYFQQNMRRLETICFEVLQPYNCVVISNSHIGLVRLLCVDNFVFAINHGSTHRRRSFDTESDHVRLLAAEVFIDLLQAADTTARNSSILRPPPHISAANIFRSHRRME